MCYIDILFYVKNKVHSISNDDNHDINDANIAKTNIHFFVATPHLFDKAEI